jgi:hypothetical protein
LEASFAAAKQVVDDEIKAGLYNPDEWTQLIWFAPNQYL